MGFAQETDGEGQALQFVDGGIHGGNVVVHLPPVVPPFGRDRAFRQDGLFQFRPGSLDAAGRVGFPHHVHADEQVDVRHEAGTGIQRRQRLDGALEGHRQFAGIPIPVVVDVLAPEIRPVGNALGVEDAVELVRIPEHLVLPGALAHAEDDVTAAVKLHPRVILRHIGQEVDG